MREAYDILVFGPASEDWSGEGLTGPLTPTEATIAAEIDGDITLSMQHPYDRIGRWKALTVGNVLQARMLMQVPPAIDASSMIETSVEVWNVSATATKAQKTLYKKATRAAKKAILAPGTEVVMLSQPATGRVKVQSGKYTGWMERDGLTYETTSTVSGTDGVNRLLGGVQWRPQYFEIQSVSMNLNDITVEARHISYRLLKNLTTYENGAETTLPDVLAGVFNGCFDALDSEEWSFQTNLLDRRSGLSWVRENPIKVFFDADTGITTKWGCECLRDNQDIYFLSQAGVDRGVRIEAGRNLAGITVSYDYSNVATHIIPVGENKNGTKFLLPEKWIVSSHADDYVQKHIYTFDASDCKIGTNGVTLAIAQARMREQAQAYLTGGCDVPTVNMTIEVAQVDSDEGRRIIELLEPLALFDRVTVIDDALGIEVQERICKVEQDPIHGRVKSIEIGALNGGMSSVKLPSWSISSVNGSKVTAGTLTASALSNDSITTRHVQAESINTAALQALSVTAEKIAAASVTTDKLEAGSVTANKIATGAVTTEKLDAGSVTAEKIAAGAIDAQVVTAVQAAIGTANIGYAQIKDASIESLFTRDGNADKYYINKLGVTSAQILNLMVGTLVFKGTDGNFYQLDATTDSDGNVSFAPSAYSGTVDEESGVTADGKRTLFEETVNVDDLYASTIHAADALITRLRVDQLYANEAFISKLKTVEITGQDGSVRVMGDILDNVTTVLDVETDGVYVRDAHGTNALKLTGEAVEIGAENTGGYARFDNDSLQFGNYELRMSMDGGLVFKLKEA